MKTYVHDGIRIAYNTENSFRFNMHKSHFHDEYEIYYLIDGSRQFYINDRVYPMSIGTLAFVDGEDMHRTFSPNNDPYTRFVVFIKKSKLQNEFPQLTTPFSNSGAIALNSAQQKQIRRLLDIIKDECEHTYQMRHEAIYALVINLFINVMRLVHEAPLVLSDGRCAAFDVIDYINSHYNEKLSLEDISENCHISISHLTRLFKKSTGYTVVQYTNNIRIKKAAELIKSTRLSISDIALKTGFSSFSYFGKLFSENYGISPLKYRNSN